MSFFEDYECISGADGDDSLVGTDVNTVFELSVGNDTIVGGSDRNALTYNLGTYYVTLDVPAGLFFNDRGDFRTSFSGISEFFWGVPYSNAL